MGYNYYGVYTACRDAAWECLCKCKIDRLPVKVIDTAKQMDIRVVRNSFAQMLEQDESGVSLYFQNRWIIVYDDSLPTEQKRIVLAHELGHICLNHDCKYADGLAHGERKIKSEREADMFAIRLLAPAFALHELHVLDAQGIASLCGIPMDVARERAAQMAKLESRGQFYKSPLERKAKQLFMPYIEETRLSLSSQ